MKIYLLFSFILFALNSSIFGQNDFFPLTVNNQFKYKYESLEIIYEMLTPDIEIIDSGNVTFEVISSQEGDSVINWGIRERGLLVRTIDTLYNSTINDLTFQNNFTNLFTLTERKDSLHQIVSNSYSEIWKSPTRWSNSFIGENFQRFSFEDSIKSIVQHRSGLYYMSDTLIFLKNLGLIRAYSIVRKGPNTLEYYRWTAELIEYNIISDLENELGIHSYSLFQNYPNPFNPVTTIKYQLLQSGSVTLKIYDVLGREVKTLVNELKEVGKYTVTLNASSFASGMYVYQLRVNDYTSTKKMLLLK
ncbi:MAG: T9SS type A sorting domain-containing protein [Ignavibacteriaceae bacterium]|nr:T9SS type A sorting domain-containing protein [Ignavibacteriaceae bacterium]